MKKILSLFLCLAIVGCSGGGASKVTEQNNVAENKQVTKVTETKPELKVESNTPKTTTPTTTLAPATTTPATTTPATTTPAATSPATTSPAITTPETTTPATTTATTTPATTTPSTEKSSTSTTTELPPDTSATGEDTETTGGVGIIPGGTSNVVETNPENENKFDFVLNKNSDIFHKFDCDSVARMKESNKIYKTSTKDEIIDMGYRACKICNP